MNITVKKIIFDVNGCEFELSFVDGEVMTSGDYETISALSINEDKVLREEALNLFLREFGDTI